MKKLVVSLSLLLNACASTEVPNEPVCVRLSNGASCFYTLEGEEKRLTEEEFKQNEIGLFFMTPTTFGEIKKFILKICKKSKKCDYDHTKKRIEEFDSQLDGLR